MIVVEPHFFAKRQRGSVVTEDFSPGERDTNASAKRDASAPLSYEASPMGRGEKICRQIIHGENPYRSDRDSTDALATARVKRPR
jgi:hypothetical protein